MGLVKPIWFFAVRSYQIRQLIYFYYYYCCYTPTSSNTLTHRSTVYHVDIVLSEYAKRTQCICPHYKSLTEKPISNKFRHYVRVFGMSMTSKLDSQTSTSFPIDRIIHVYTDQRQAEVTGMVSDANNQQTICVDGPQSFNVFNCVSLTIMDQSFISKTKLNKSSSSGLFSVVSRSDET